MVFRARVDGPGRPVGAAPPWVPADVLGVAPPAAGARGRRVPRGGTRPAGLLAGCPAVEGGRLRDRRVGRRRARARRHPRRRALPPGRSRLGCDRVVARSGRVSRADRIADHRLGTPPHPVVPCAPGRGWDRPADPFAVLRVVSTPTAADELGGVDGAGVRAVRGQRARRTRRRAAPRGPRRPQRLGRGPQLVSRRTTSTTRRWRTSRCRRSSCGAPTTRRSRWKPAEWTADHVDAPYRFEVFDDVGHWIPEVEAERFSSLLLDHLSATTERNTE